MKGLFDSMKPSSSTRDKLIKASLVQKLSESVKEIQLNHSSEQISGNYNSGDADSALCSVLEAIFLHGLKDSLIQVARKALIVDIDEKPQPSFWSLLLVLSHRQIISQIQSLPQVTTEAGYCRAWLRQALNDSLLSSYLVSMQRDGKVLRQYYGHHAYVRDSDLLNITQHLLSGVEACATFNLAVNSSLLNHWSNPSLLMAGIWSLPLRSCPISSGVDVARSLDVTPTAIHPDGASLISYESTSSGLGKFAALNESEALRIILGSTSVETPATEAKNQSKIDSQKVIAEKGCTETTKRSEDKEIKSELETEPSQDAVCLGNSLNAKCSWSFGGSETESTDDDLIRSGDFDSLLESYNMSSEGWQKYSGKNLPRAESERRQSRLEDSLLGLGYEIVPPSASMVFSVTELNYFMNQLKTIPQEKGLDSQKYLCSDCGNTLGISFAKPSSTCAFSGDYFCEDCMSQDTFIIPARVIYNWDFRRYLVSNKAAMFLTDFKDHPLVNVKVMNPLLYNVVEEMEILQTFRVQLNLLRAYLYTCREPVIEQLQRRVWPKEYLYECIHQYSISDLEAIVTGGLVTQLQQVVEFAKSHVRSCWLCSQKGFICEVCNDPKVLYPFDLNNTFRCEVCSAVFHKECLETSAGCTKCKRRRERKHLPL